MADDPNASFGPPPIETTWERLGKMLSGFATQGMMPMRSKRDVWMQQAQGQEAANKLAESNVQGAQARAIYPTAAANAGYEAAQYIPQQQEAKTQKAIAGLQPYANQINSLPPEQREEYATQLGRNLKLLGPDERAPSMPTMLNDSVTKGAGIEEPIIPQAVGIYPTVEAAQAHQAETPSLKEYVIKPTISGRGYVFSPPPTPKNAVEDPQTRASLAWYGRQYSDASAQIRSFEGELRNIQLGPAGLRALKSKQLEESGSNPATNSQIGVLEAQERAVRGSLTKAQELQKHYRKLSEKTIAGMKGGGGSETTPDADQDDTTDSQAELRTETDDTLQALANDPNQPEAIKTGAQSVLAERAAVGPAKDASKLKTTPKVDVETLRQQAQQKIAEGRDPDQIKAIFKQATGQDY